jgi:pectinesterase
MKRTSIALVLTIAFFAPALPARQAPQVTCTLRNPIDLARPAESIVLQRADVQRALGADDLRRVHVRDAATNQELLAQAIDVNDDGVFEQLLFQADFAPRQTRRLTLAAGEPLVYSRDQFRAYGRFVRERRDDFAWENDRVAHRMYGLALETWAQEPLTSSAVDVWVKRTRRLVINDWYMVDDYHRDHGEGADLYSAGKSRGCGGSGIWDGGKLYTSSNFTGTRVLANGPLRVMFELSYPAWQANGRPVSEMKRISLDAGQNLSRFESHYTNEAGRAVQHAAGIKKQADTSVSRNAQLGILRTWESVKGAGYLGCGIVVDPSRLVDFAEADGNYLVVANVPRGEPATCYAGFAWDKSGDFAGVADWDKYLEDFSRRLRAPIEVRVGDKTVPGSRP